MRNLYEALGIESDASEETIRLACRELLDHEPEFARETSGILLDAEKRELYDQVYKQYLAMALVTEKANGGNLGSLSPFTDTNSWSKRLVEFS